VFEKRKMGFDAPDIHSMRIYRRYNLDDSNLNKSYARGIINTNFT